MLPQIIAVPFCITDGVEPSNTTVTFPAGTKGPMTKHVGYSDPLRHDVEDFAVEATILQPQFGLFDDEGDYSDTAVSVFYIPDYYS